MYTKIEILESTIGTLRANLKYFNSNKYDN